MPIPYRARLDAREFLNLPGFHGGAYVLAYVEDTRFREASEDDPADPWPSGPPAARMILEIADCSDRISLEFDIYSEARRENSLYKITTLIAVLERFRDAYKAEAQLYAERVAEEEARKTEDGERGGEAGNGRASRRRKTRRRRRAMS